jgi:rare lipoprotein A
MALGIGRQGATAAIGCQSASALVIPVRLAAVTLVALLTANCGSQIASQGRSGNKYGVAVSPKVIPDGQPIPKGGGRAMIGKPYVVGDKTYVPQEGRGYVREGEASWYGTAFHGRLTANGEVFDKESIAAAHPTLPLPSYVRVTNLANHRSMIVRVNDRGPYERGRLIDLSEKAADALEFHRRGTSHVRVEYVGKASLGGSDDRKLLATLRTDGEPAGMGRRSPVMLAALDERGAGRPDTPLAYRPVEPRPAPVRPALEEADDAPAPMVLASRDLGPPSRLAEPLAESRLERPIPAPRREIASRVEPAPLQTGVAGLNPTAPARAPIRVAEQGLGKGDRLVPDRLVPDRSAPTRASRAGQPLDLAAIRAAINAAPAGPPARLASNLPPGRPGTGRLPPEADRKGPGKLQIQLSHKGDRLRVADK